MIILVGRTFFSMWVGFLITLGMLILTKILWGIWKEMFLGEPKDDLS